MSALSILHFLLRLLHRANANKAIESAQQRVTRGILLRTTRATSLEPYAIALLKASGRLLMYPSSREGPRRVGAGGGGSEALQSRAQCE